ncbi:lipid IV(A) 3-deoxy-D-manno-octulosonic acid transferase [Shewanella sedimentimangrovi]|uniref:3-deoxy-D-manno-octulosonic acid transferase n=1 Tax=Shewanella sedimentimangrovi TaxID=2814293 RepID=A0ABX7R0Q9_9GAMM|nr:lipid IV(A) 3-deoxy-D-manno-octulosonic acid transferase [Shewanella sedimentimangrovi]QSX37381.1 lipid IV(A) 3-deoxy-D-manno-octulosonic acid transferase [Shewanella sedimentimangrovi]
MNRLLYSLLLYLLSPLLLLYLALRASRSADYRGRWAERFGLATLQPCDLLIHSVSMGETLAALPLIRAILAKQPGIRITVTTTSPTGSAEVVKALGAQVQHCYLPFDLPWCVARFLRALNASELIIMETELWPNLIHLAKARGMKVQLANARLSAKSATSYHKWHRLTGPMLASIDRIAVQTQIEAERFQALGVAAQRIAVCGSLKFDLQIDESRREQARQLRQQWGRETDPVWVAGSVHPGEFAAVLAAHKALLTRFPQALLIFVPRHPEQFVAAAQAISDTGLSLARRSAKEAPIPGVQVLLGDTMGELLTWYGVASIYKGAAFVGGTLIHSGGHNPLEPAAMGLPVALGPNHWDFTEISRLLQLAGNLTLVQDGEALGDLLSLWFTDEPARATAGAAGLAVVEQNRGAQERQLAWLSQE